MTWRSPYSSAVANAQREKNEDRSQETGFRIKKAGGTEVQPALILTPDFCLLAALSRA